MWYEFVHNGEIIPSGFKMAGGEQTFPRVALVDLYSAVEPEKVLAVEAHPSEAVADTRSRERYRKSLFLKKPIVYPPA